MVAARRYRRLIDVLSPVLGVGGVGLVFARSLRLTSQRYPCLENVFTLEGTAAMAQRLHLALALQDEHAAETASIALFSSFMGLLETFLGTALATRLLRDIGPDRTLKPAWLGLRHDDAGPSEACCPAHWGPRSRRGAGRWGPGVSLNLICRRARGWQDDARPSNHVCQRHGDRPALYFTVLGEAP